MAVQWFYRMFGQDFGPISVNELRDLIQAGSVTASDEVRAENSPSWVLAGSVHELGSVIPSDEISDSGVQSPPDPVRNDDWFCKIGIDEIGPVGFQDVISYAEQGRLRAEDEVKLGVTGKWRNVGSIGRLVSVLPFQEPVSNPVQTAPKRSATPPASAPVPMDVRPPAADPSQHQTDITVPRPLPPHSALPAPAAVMERPSFPPSTSLAGPTAFPPRPVARPAYSSDRSNAGIFRRPLGIAGTALILVLLAGVGWMFWPNPAAADIERYKNLKQLLDDIRAAREAKATDFEPLRKRILKLNQEYPRLLKPAASRRPATQKLLEATRDHLPKLYFVDLSHETGYEKDFEASLKEAAKLLGIK